MDTSITTVIDKTGIAFDIPDNFGVSKGNKALSNRFIITLLTDPGSSFISGGYGGDLVNNIVSAGAVDSGVLAASVKLSCDTTVRNMKIEQGDLDPTEKIVSASVIAVNKIADKVYITIDIVPVQRDGLENPRIILPL
jgi:hypothetical protein